MLSSRCRGTHFQHLKWCVEMEDFEMEIPEEGRRATGIEDSLNYQPKTENHALTDEWGIEIEEDGTIWYCDLAQLDSPPSSS